LIGAWGETGGKADPYRTGEKLDREIYHSKNSEKKGAEEKKVELPLPILTKKKGKGKKLDSGKKATNGRAVTEQRKRRKGKDKRPPRPLKKKKPHHKPQRGAILVRGPTCKSTR